MTNPTVSVIIPTYKHSEFVLTTLDSVFAQTFTDYEVIVINDGSPDDTAEVLRPLAESGRIRYIEQKNTGQSIARNRAIAEAKGEFVALLDDDDLWPPDKLEWQVQALRKRPEAGVIAGPANVIDAQGLPIFRSGFMPEITLPAAYSGTPIISPGQTLIRASLLRELGGLNPNLWGVDDWELWLRVLKQSRILMEDQDALLYRSHPGNASKNVCRMLDNCFKVMDIHLVGLAAPERLRLRRQSYRWFYRFLGAQLVYKMKHAARSGDLRLLPAYLARLLKLGRVLMSDPVTLKSAFSAFQPGRPSVRPEPTSI